MRKRALARCLSSWSHQHSTAGSWSGQVSTLSVPKPWATPHPPALCARARALLSSESLAAARALLQALRLDRDADSVDRLPSFELRWIDQGAYTHAGLEAALRTEVEQRVVPAVRALLGRPELVLCEALLRAYQPGRRRAVPAHYDGDALATAVVEIDGRYTGPGFYLQTGADAASRLPMPLEPGDLLAHSFDLQHGVSVEAGQRASLVFWFADSTASCRSKARPWYDQAAAAGDVDASMNLGLSLYQAAIDLEAPGSYNIAAFDHPAAASSGSADEQAIGRHRERERERLVAEAHRLMGYAAEQGHWKAQTRLAAMKMRCGEPEAAERWLRRAAGQGYARAMLDLSALLADADQPAEARSWLERAAEQRLHPDSMHQLAHHYRTDGAVAEQAHWLVAAAEAGLPEAQLELGQALLAVEPGQALGEALAAELGLRPAEPGVSEAAVSWIERASDQGSREAALALARLYARQSRPGRLVRLGSEWAAALFKPSSKWSWS